MKELRIGCWCWVLKITMIIHTHTRTHSNIDVHTHAQSSTSLSLCIRSAESINECCALFNIMWCCDVYLFIVLTYDIYFTNLTSICDWFIWWSLIILVCVCMCVWFLCVCVCVCVCELPLLICSFVCSWLVRSIELYI